MQNAEKFPNDVSLYKSSTNTKNSNISKNNKNKEFLDYIYENEINLSNSHKKKTNKPKKKIIKQIFNNRINSYEDVSF